jgi:hypothetical protein
MKEPKVAVGAAEDVAVGAIFDIYKLFKFYEIVQIFDINKFMLVRQCDKFYKLEWPKDCRIMPKKNRR